MLFRSLVRFNTTSVPAVWVSSEELRCTVPEHTTGLVSVEVTQNEQQYTSSSVHFEYEDVAAYSIEPASGPVRGGTTVLVRGASLHDAPGGGEYGAWCSFAGLDVVGASFDGEGTVRCVTPAAERTGAVTLHLVHDDAVLPTSVAFRYHAPMVVSSVEPVVGVLSGGTLVRVRGSGFSPSAPSAQLVVRVGERAIVGARVLSATLLECTTPSQLLPGPLALEVSRNARDFTVHEEHLVDRKSVV